jgi:hypothetical protein
MKRYIHRRDENREPAIIKHASTAIEIILAICIILAIFNNVIF